MANTKTWPDPDTQVAQQGRADVHGVYLLDPVTQKAVTPATGSGGGGGGGAVTVADGADVTQGTSTDANTVASIMGRLTKIRDLLNATLTVGGTITEANSAAIATNTTGIATQATLAQVKSDLDTLVTNTADLLADGDNLATIATNTTGAATAANQGTGNTSLASIKTDLDEIALDTDNLATIAGAITAAIMQSNTAQIAGTTTAVNAGTVSAGTQRVVQGSAATGTKSNVVSSASSVTILAANTSRKGAMVYNDSTAILYLDLSGGTASTSSYSVQVGAQAFFELPGPIIYNGLITGIWASANGNARVTEFS